MIDASHPEWEEHLEVVDRELITLGINGDRTIHVFNKADLVSDRDALVNCARFRNLPKTALTAAREGDVGELVSWIAG